jgi:hypothetical protein
MRFTVRIGVAPSIVADSMADRVRVVAVSHRVVDGYDDLPLLLTVRRLDHKRRVTPRPHRMAALPPNHPTIYRATPRIAVMPIPASRRIAFCMMTPSLRLSSAAQDRARQQPRRHALNEVRSRRRSGRVQRRASEQRSSSSHTAPPRLPQCPTLIVEATTYGAPTYG